MSRGRKKKIWMKQSLDSVAGGPGINQPVWWNLSLQHWVPWYQCNGSPTGQSRFIKVWRIFGDRVEFSHFKPLYDDGADQNYNWWWRMLWTLSPLQPLSPTSSSSSLQGHITGHPVQLQTKSSKWKKGKFGIFSIEFAFQMNLALL